MLPDPASPLGTLIAAALAVVIILGPTLRIG